MSATDTSGPAFPNELDEGMTLRDYFAGKAIVECIRVAESQTPQTIREPKLSVLFDKAALYAYAVADAMLKARNA